MMLKVLITFLIFYSCSCGIEKEELLARKSQLQDTIEVNVFYNSDTLFNKDQSIELRIINLKRDTILLMPNPFFIESSLLTKDYLWVGFPDFSTPNIIYVEKNKSLSRFSGDGMYKIPFLKIPPIAFLNPKDTISLNINLPKNLTKNISNKEILIQGFIIYTSKLKADSLADKLNDSLKNEYSKSVFKKTNIVIAPIEPLRYYSNTIISDSSVSKFIWEAFDKKIKYLYKN